MWLVGVGGRQLSQALLLIGRLPIWLQKEETQQSVRLGRDSVAADHGLLGEGLEDRKKVGEFL